MIATANATVPRPATAVGARALQAAATAVAVALLVVSTLGTVSAVIVGASLDLLGVPDLWAWSAAGVAAAATVPAAAALARTAWRTERQGLDA